MRVLKLSPLAMALGIASSLAVAQQSEQKEQNYPRIEMIEVIGHATGGLDSAVDGDYLEATQPIDLEDVFRADPDVTTGGSVGMSQKIYVRNIGEDALNITIDGAEQANGVFHHAGRVSLEPELLKRVDIEAGAGSATAGPGALGGAVHFTTKDPSDLLKTGENFGALVKAGGSTNGDGTKGSVSLFGMNESGSFGGLVSYVYTDNDLLEDGASDELAGTESEQTLGYIKLVGNIADGHSLMLSHETLEEEGDMPYRSEWRDSHVTPTEGKRQTTTFNYGYNPESDAADLVTTIYTTKNEHERYYDPNDATPVAGYVGSSGINLQNTSILGSHELIYGVNYRKDKGHLNYVYAGSAYEFDEDGSVKGIFIQDIYTVTDKLTLSFGARFDEYEFTSQDDTEVDTSGAAPNISANYAITPELSISAGYAQAVRGVEVADAYKSESLKYDEDVDVETADNAEIAVDYQLGGFSVSGGVFATTIKDALWYRDELGIFAPWNGIVDNYDEDIETEGFFLNVGYAAEEGSIAAKFLSADTDLGGQTATRYLGGSKANSIGDTLVLDGRYNILEGLQLGVVVETVMGINNIDQTLEEDAGGGAITVYDLTVDKPGYTVVNLSLYWVPSFDKDLSVSFVVNNVFDEEYLSHASIEDYSHNRYWEEVKGSPSPGRDARLTVGYNF